MGQVLRVERRVSPVMHDSPRAAAAYARAVQVDGGIQEPPEVRRPLILLPIPHSGGLPALQEADHDIGGESLGEGVGLDYTSAGSLAPSRRWNRESILSAGIPQNVALVVCQTESLTWPSRPRPSRTSKRQRFLCLKIQNSFPKVSQSSP